MPSFAARGVVGVELRASKDRARHEVTERARAYQVVTKQGRNWGWIAYQPTRCQGVTERRVDALQPLSL